MGQKLKTELETHRAEIAEAAQKVVDEWDQDEQGFDCELGSGGVCDRVGEAIAGVLVQMDVENLEITEGGQPGDDHAWLIVHDYKDAFAVDIPPSVYETGGGYVWRKKEGAKIEPEYVIFEPFDIEHLELEETTPHPVHNPGALFKALRNPHEQKEVILPPLPKMPSEEEQKKARLTRAYWDTKLEQNPLRIGSIDTDAGAWLAYYIEAAGDILRELAGNRDAGYYGEKITRIKKSLPYTQDWSAALSAGEIERLDQTKALLRDLPAHTEEMVAVKALITTIADRDTQRIGQNMEVLEAAIKRGTEVQHSVHNPGALFNALGDPHKESTFRREFDRLTSEIQQLMERFYAEPKDKRPDPDTIRAKTEELNQLKKKYIQRRIGEATRTPLSDETIIFYLTERGPSGRIPHQVGVELSHPVLGPLIRLHESVEIAELEHLVGKDLRSISTEEASAYYTLTHAIANTIAPASEKARELFGQFNTYEELAQLIKESQA